MVCLQEVYETLCSAVHNEAILILNRLELERNRHVLVIYATKGDMGVQYGFEVGNIEKVFRYDVLKVRNNRTKLFGLSDNTAR